MVYARHSEAVQTVIIYHIESLNYHCIKEMNYPQVPNPRNQSNNQWHNAVTAALNQHSNDLVAIRAMQQQFQAQLQAMQQQQLQQFQQLQVLIQQQNNPLIVVAERNASRRANNRTPGVAYLPLLSAAGLVPPGFPTDRKALMGLTVPAINGLLAFYQLPLNGNRSDKLDRLFTFVTAH